MIEPQYETLHLSGVLIQWKIFKKKLKELTNYTSDVITDLI